mgnify:CR=1 FL=1
MGAPMAVGMGAMSFMAAQRQNRAVSRGISAAGSAYSRNLDSLIDKREVTTKQVEDKTEVDMMKNYYTGLKLGGSARVVAGARGTTTTSEGSASRIETQTILDRLANANILDKNWINTIKAINADYTAGTVQNLNQYTSTTSQLAMQYQDPFMSAIQGGISGYATGVQI